MTPLTPTTPATPLIPDLDDRVTSSKRRAALLLGGFGVAVAVVALALGLVVGLDPRAGLVVAVGVSVLAAGTAYLTCDAVALRLTQARAADPISHARLHNLVEWLCFSSGLPKPRVCVVDDEALNAFAAGRGPRRSAVAVTTGLLKGLTRVELEAVLAHELSHVKSYDVLVSTLAVTLVALPASVLPGRVAARLVDLAVGAPREAVADLAGVSITRYPPGLISALEKLRDGPTAVRSGARLTAHLWTEPPVEPGPGQSPEPGRGQAGAPSLLDERIEALRDL